MNAASLVGEIFLAIESLVEVGESILAVVLLDGQTPVLVVESVSEDDAAFKILF